MRWLLSPHNSEVLAVHAALLHTGKVLYFSGSQHIAPPHDPPLSPGEQQSYLDHTRLWDPVTGSVQRVASPAPIYDVFCSGHAFLEDGALLVAGGTSGYPPRPPAPHFDHFQGLRNAALFISALAERENPWWHVAPMHTEIDREAHRVLDRGGGRWYPTLVALADGGVVALGGHPAEDDDRHSNYVVEVFRRFPTTQGSWVDVGDVPEDVLRAAEAHETPETYPRAHLLPGGDVFFVRLLGGRSWRWTPRTGAWTPVTEHEGLPSLIAGSAQLGYVEVAFRRYNRTLFAWTSVLLPLLPEQGYRARILVAGRTQPFTINMSETAPQWRPTDPRDQSNRGLFDASRDRAEVGASDQPGFIPASQSGMRQGVIPVLLPDSTVMFVGGSTTEPRHSAGLDRDAVLVPEVYDPDNGTWSSVSAVPIVPRIYHAVALLLQDGRVWTAGSNHDSDLGDEARELRIEVFEPWYFSRPRPTISSSPHWIHHGGEFDLFTPQASLIRRVAIIRAGSVTHGFNSDQRYIGLNFRPVADSRLVVEAPPSGGLAPAGYYLLFLVDNNGVPSVGAFLRIGRLLSIVSAIIPVERGASLFVIGLDDQVWSTFFDPRQAIPRWADWFPIGPNVFDQSSAVSALSVLEGGASLFVRGRDQRIWSTFFDPNNLGPRERGGWQNWFPIGPNVFPKGATVSAVKPLERGTSLFAVGIDGRVWSTFFDPRQANPRWADWFPIGPNVFHQRSAVSALNTVEGGVSLFVVGIDGRVWSTFFDPNNLGPRERGGWQNWFPIGPNVFPKGATVSAVKPVERGASLFIIGIDGQVWSTFFDPRQANPRWADWFPIGPNVFPQAATIAAVSSREGGVSLFVLGFDGQVWSTFFDPNNLGPRERGGWQDWFPIGSNVFPSTSTISALSTAFGSVSLFTLGFDGRMWSTFFDPNNLGPRERGGWQDWFPIGPNVFPHG